MSRALGGKATSQAGPLAPPWVLAKAHLWEVAASPSMALFSSAPSADHLLETKPFLST